MIRDHAGQEYLLATVAGEPGGRAAATPGPGAGLDGLPCHHRPRCHQHAGPPARRHRAGTPTPHRAQHRRQSPHRRRHRNHHRARPTRARWAFAAGTPGALGWIEYITRHAPQADRFYTRLFGYRGHQFGDGTTVDYLVYYTGDDSVIGRVRMDPGTPADVPPRWIAHFVLQPHHDFDQTLRRAHAAGARLRFPPYPSTLGKVAVLSDPHGTRFASLNPHSRPDGTTPPPSTTPTTTSPAFTPPGQTRPLRTQVGGTCRSLRVLPGIPG